MVLGAATEQVQDGSLLVAAAIAVLAGVVSFLSPCVLPLVPAYLSFTTGLSAADLGADAAAPAEGHVRRVVLGTGGFVAGAAVVFVSFGAIFGQAGDLLQEHSAGLTQIFGVVTIIFGLLLTGALGRVGFLNREVRIHTLPGKGLIGAPILGLTFALGWTPCVGPTLGVVLGLAASSDNASAARGAALSVAYCLGLGIPLLVTGLAFQRAMSAFAVVRRHHQALMVTGGLMLVLLGILQVTGVWTMWMGEIQTRLGGASLPL